MLGKLLRILGIVLLGVTAVITLLSGVGTTCVALDPVKYEMDAIAPFQWLYILYVIAGIVIGVMGIYAVVALIRRRPNAYRSTIAALVLGILVGGVHMATSRALRGNSMPLDFIVYANVITLVYFLIMRIPGIWNKVNLNGEDNDIAGLGAAAAMIVAGIVILTVQIWAGPTHVINGINYADVWHTQMAIVGGTLLFFGAALLLGELLGLTLPHPWRKAKAQPLRLNK